MPPISIYVLTYNTPSQFRLWCESFSSAQLNAFSILPKYVINNSDDPAVRQEYDSLFAEFDFKVISSGQNLGINGGRYRAATHFQESGQNYMIFFEDDMLLRNSLSAVCRAGFKTYHATLFEDAVNILEQESLSFMKLCFSEVYNTNHENIALQSLYEPDRQEIMKADPREFFLASNVCVDYTDICNGLSYGVGAYAYCNWPILFTQQANQLIFMDNQLESKFEMAYTRLAYLLTLMGKLRVGCLFASPIKHWRQYSYNPADRIENEQGLRIPGVQICLDTN
ncbi:glycosyltransferase family 2 protein [Spirosoma flavum]|uniref:Glycosyltransferase family 2 protein n=1 Tax=Spirosoma flavum TaxID=2048557 RepID=A0ABW6AU31_9BACT